MAHILSPWSSGLFAKAIIQSPSQGGLLDLRTLITTQEPQFYAQQGKYLFTKICAGNHNVKKLSRKCKQRIFQF